MHTDQVKPSDCYRLPWSLNDNVLGWLEPTKACNLYCQGCYSTNDPKSNKSLEQVRADLDVFVSRRKVDSISIAGGDPLVHPEIVEIVRIITEEYGLKAVLNTNGLALDRELCEQLKGAGLTGFTFHIDSSQGRPHWKDADDAELNELRLWFAELVASVGGMSVAFNCTVFRDTMHHIPAILDWGREHVDIVHTLVFILFRTARSGEFKYFANGQEVQADDELVYYDQDKNPKPLSAQEVIDVIRAHEPEYAPAAYLGGTKDPNSFKWLLAARLATKDDVLGYVGPRYMELVQTGHHFATGRYLAYVPPNLLTHGRSMLAGFAPFDHKIRKMATRWASKNFLRPWKYAEKLHFQSVLIIQPIDMMPDGEMNMCDGCPDMTVSADGELVWSCRLDEQQKYGCFLTAAPTPAQAK